MRLSIRQTPATALLLAAIALVFLGQQLDSSDLLLRLGADQPQAVLAHGQYWRLLSSMFLHGGWAHVLLNSWALYQIGALFELWLGAGRLLGTYFATGIAASLTSVLWNWRTGGNPEQLSVGASGAIFGLIGALIAFLARRRGRLNPAARSILSQLLFWAGINIFLLSNLGMIDNAAHIGGLVAGLGIGLLLHDPEPLLPPQPPPLPDLPP
jgi:rhomboid protease GluP